MKYLKICIVVFFDGFIVIKDNELDWMFENVKKEILEVYEQLGVLFVGVNIYIYIFEYWGGWLYKSKKIFVVFYYDINVLEKENVSFFIDMLLCVVNEFKLNLEIDIQVIGGGKFIIFLIEVFLFDEIMLYIILVMLGNGIKFIGKIFGLKWELI